MRKFLFSTLLLSSLIFPFSASALDLKFAWNPNTETDLAGYRIYQGNATGGPYTQMGEIGVMPQPQFVWQVPPGTEAMRYFVVTALDAAGNESGYSNEVAVRVDNVGPNPPTGLQISINISITIP